MDEQVEIASGLAADNHHHHLHADRPQAQAAGTSPGKSIRFFEYASVIPQLDPEQLHEHVAQAYGHHGRPHLTSRTYSVPIPSSITSFFASPPPREYTYDPAFIPNAPPRLNLKLPSFVRKRRNTIACQSHLKSILKKRKVVIGGLATKSSTSSTTTTLSGKGCRGRSYTLASSAPVSAPSASCSISNINPVYCPALARVVSQAADAHPDSASSLSSTPPSASRLSTTPPNADSAISPTVGSPIHPLPLEPTELLPIRDCCRACRRAATYGEKCTDSTYHENWSKAALEKRKRDEETKYERGEYITHDNTAARKRLDSRSPGGSDRTHEAGSDVVQEVEKLEKEEAKHCHALHSPAHSPLYTSQHPHSVEQASHTSHNPPLPPVLAHVHNRVQACQEAKREKQVAHEEELDAARQRIARLDIGKKFIKHEEEEDQDRDSASSDEQEGNDLQLEGVNDGSKDLSSPPPLSSGQRSGHPSSRKVSSAMDDEHEKNPICTLDGQVLRPCSSKSLYTGGPSFRSPTTTTTTTTTNTGLTNRESDQVSNTSSSDLSDDIVSNLSSLGLSPASATTNASSWFGGEELASPPKRSLKENNGKKDYFGSSSDNAAKATSAQQDTDRQPAKNGTGGAGCSPLRRTKCLRPAGLYAPIPAAGEETVCPSSCSTIREESLPSTPTEMSTLPRQSIHRANTTPIAPSIIIDKEVELREALRDADKPLFTIPVRTQSLPAEAGRRTVDTGSGNAPVSDEDIEGNRHQQKTSWTRRIFHPGRTFSALGVAHGIVH